MESNIYVLKQTNNFENSLGRSFNRFRDSYLHFIIITIILGFILRNLGKRAEIAQLWI